MRGVSGGVAIGPALGVPEWRRPVCSTRTRSAGPAGYSSTATKVTPWGRTAPERSFSCARSSPNPYTTRGLYLLAPTLTPIPPSSLQSSTRLSPFSGRPVILRFTGLEPRETHVQSPTRGARAGAIRDAGNSYMTRSVCNGYAGGSLRPVVPPCIGEWPRQHWPHGCVGLLSPRRTARPSCSNWDAPLFPFARPSYVYPTLFTNL